MNIFILLVFLVVICILNYYTNTRNILAPSVIVSAVFTLSVLLVVISYSTWKYDVHFVTVILIILAVSLFSIGCSLGQKVIIKTGRTKKNNSLLNEFDFDLNNETMAMLSIICIAVTSYYFYHQYKLALSLGNTAGVIGIVGTIRSKVLSNPEVFQLGIGLNIGISLLRAIGNISLFNLCVAIICKDRKIKKYVIPVACLIIYAILTTGRAPFIGYVASILMNIYIIQKKRGVAAFNKKMLRITLRGFALFMIFFWLLGFLTDKGEITFWDTLSIYAGSSIVCLDDVISKPMEHSVLFGQNIFIGIYNILRRLGINIPSQSLHSDFVYWGGKYSSNIYTSLMPYIRDFGLAVAVIVQIPLGTIFGMAWKRYNSEYASPIFIMTYGRFFAIALAMYSIAENFLTSILTSNVLVEIFFYFVLSFLLKRKK